jgi:two-component SAPR family response regulator
MAASEPSSVAVYSLGGFSMTVDGRPVEQLRAGKTRSLFQYLLVNRGQVVLREQLYDVLWPGVEWSPESSRLKVAVHTLRRLLKNTGASIRVLHRDFGYVLLADHIWVDYEEFEAWFDAARAADARGDIDFALRLYRKCVGFYRGDFLAGETAQWVNEHREWTRAIALRAMNRLRVEALSKSSYDEVVLWCRRILDLDPYHEETYQMLMWVHGRSGELASVGSWYQLCCRRLREELDVEPAPATERIYAMAMRGDLRPGSQPPRPPAPVPIDQNRTRRTPTTATQSGPFRTGRAYRTG